MSLTKMNIQMNANKNAMMKNWKGKKKSAYIKEVRFDYFAWSKTERQHDKYIYMQAP